jgi:hypothetical protein
MNTTFGRLTVLGPGTKKGWVKVLCACKLGDESQAHELRKASLTRKTKGTRSCGCLRRETTAKRMGIHYQSHSPQYQAFLKIKDHLFKDYRHFIDCLGKRPPGGYLARKDPEQPHGPLNSFWGNTRQQVRKSRTGIVGVYHANSSTGFVVHHKGKHIGSFATLKEAAHAKALAYGDTHSERSPIDINGRAEAARASA